MKKSDRHSSDHSRRRGSHGRGKSDDFRAFNETHDFIKTMQLCSQIKDKLELLFSGDLEDPFLQEIWPESVVQMHNAVYTVTLRVRDAEEIPMIREALQRAAKYIRGEVATGIHRKKTPILRFELLPAEKDKGGSHAQE